MNEPARVKLPVRATAQDTRALILACDELERIAGPAILDATDGSGLRRQSGMGGFSSGLDEHTVISWNGHRDRFPTGPACDKSRRIHPGVLSDATPGG